MSAILAHLAVALNDRYRVVRELGAGGMATVYLAHDVKHDREVALKVLHPDLGAALGAERFLSEIKTTARLRHPHILPLLDSGETRSENGEASGLLYYVMPFVHGETLRSRLTRERQLPVEVALRIARECADALQHAHDHGIIHRDIKPENILLQDGHAVVADFGIALAVQSAGGARMTQTGLSLGTPQYMSPEQAMGEKSLDARSDIYALGAVVYEMLTGEPPFTGASVQAIVAKVLTERPVPVSTTRDTVSLGVERAVLKSLAKLPADRFASARDFAEALEGRSESALQSDVVRTAPRPAPTARAWQAATAFLALLALAASLLAWRESVSGSEVAKGAHVIRSRLDIPEGVTIADALPGNTIAVSPDGSMIAFTSVAVNGYRMYVRRVNELEARDLSDANLAGRNLTFSPDGKWVAFSEGNLVRKVPVDGGAPVDIGTTAAAAPYGMVWAPDNTLYIGSFSGMRAVSPSGGEASLVRRADSTSANLGQRWPMLTPDEKSIIYASGNGSQTPGRMAVVELATGTVTNFDLQLSMPVGVVGDQLVYVNVAGELLSVGIEPGTYRPRRQPQVLETGLYMDPTSGAKVALSHSGTLLYMKGQAQMQPVLVSPTNGSITPLISEPRLYQSPRFSPNGRRVAMTVVSPTATDVWSYDLQLRTMSRITSTGTNMRPEWTPDGKAVVFLSNRSGRIAIWRQGSDGSGSAELLYEPKQEPFEALISMDQQWIVYRTAPGLEYSRDILAVPLAAPSSGERAVKELATGPGAQQLPRFSPDGKWLAYQSNESGRFEVIVRPFPGDAARVPVSANGGTEPIWGRDGNSLYYRGPVNEIIKVNVTTGATFSIGASTTIARGEYLLDTSHQSWDVAPDGRLLLLKRAGEPSQLIVVHNWARELRERTRAR
ncbi:MAG: protein kinase [Gemmatimonas sp.]